jgi:ribosomal-protein-alanine N-acetyltransferase
VSLPPFFLDSAGLDDVPSLVGLEARCYSHPWSPRMFEEAVRAAPGRVLVLRARRPDGGVGILAYCAFQAAGGEAEIHNLAVDPGHRRRGLGRRLLDLALARAARRGARSVVLEVRESNQAALRLYRAMGFATVGVREGYYEQPKERALVLRKSLEIPEGAC